MSFFLCLLALAVGAGAQPVSAGLKAGAAVTGDIERYWATSESKRITFGPMAVFRLGRGFSVEFDALYQRAGYRVAQSFLSLEYVNTRARGNSWSFPMLLRGSVAGGVYIAGGYAPRIINGHQNVTVVEATSLDMSAYRIFQSEYAGEWQTAHGVVAAAGIEARVGRLRAGPEIRYTYWATPALAIQGSRGFAIDSERHQVEAFVGLRF